MRVVIVDDEAPARRRLVRMLARVADVTVVGEAPDTVAARALIEQTQPDVVLLDINMPEESGLSLAQWASMPPVIFVTAHDEHAVAAFELAAVDYLLKPLTQARLETALARVRDRAQPVDAKHLAEALRAAMSPRAVRITARSGTTLHVFEAAAIARISARDKYSVFTVDGVEYVMDESLTALQTRLGEQDFVRVHRSELVNLGRVVALHGGEATAELELTGGQRVPVSRRSLPEIRRRLER